MAETTMIESTENAEVLEGKLYTFRKLKSTDVFLMSKIIGKIGVNEFTACFEKDGIKKMIASFSGGNEDTSNITSVVGFSVVLEIANVILNNLPKCEKEIFAMLAEVSGLHEFVIKDFDAVVFMEMVIDFIKKEEFKDFIKVVSKLFK